MSAVRVPWIALASWGFAGMATLGLIGADLGCMTAKQCAEICGAAGVYQVADSACTCQGDRPASAQTPDERFCAACKTTCAPRPVAGCFYGGSVAVDRCECERGPQ